MAKYEVRVRYAFEGTYMVAAGNREEAKRMVEEDCGLVLGGNIHTTRDDDEVTDWNFGIHPESQILSIKETGIRPASQSGKGDHRSGGAEQADHHANP